jgi:glycogen operon protein
MSEEWTRTEGSPWPLGATWVAEAGAFNFALYAKDATAVSLMLYAEADLANPLVTLPFTPPRERTGRIWHKRVSAETAADAKYYAYRVDGPPGPETGARFDPAKVLLDPYAKVVLFPPGHDRGAACAPGSNAGKAPLGVLPPAEATPCAKASRGPRRGHDLVIYELHVRGFTKRVNSGVTDARRGTYAGAAAKIPYLQKLGVTAVELMPVHQFDPEEGSYWGYMTLNFFSPHYQYSSTGDPAGAIAEFREMVEAFHAAGIEVILDVVYNHTTEGGDGGPTYSYRGIDNSAYYALVPGDLKTYVNHSGCGNDLRTAHPATRRLVVDSLRHWADAFGVDGFRFDLASIFAFSEDGSLNLADPPIISEIAGDPDLAGIRLIAEPWDADGSAYVIGRAFPGHTWQQWNDHFRDTARSFIKGGGGLAGDLAARLYGSTDLFPDDLVNSYRRWQSVNLVDCHDGLNMCDLVSYANQGQRSWNCGFEGVAGAPADVVALRRRQVKNFCALLMLANGVPMFCMGDEFMNTQGGDANPYNKDNETTWLDWSLAEANAEMVRFFAAMIGFRKAHPAIGRDIGWGADVAWHGISGGGPDYGPDSRALAYCLRGGTVGDADLYVMFNADWRPAAFTISAAGAWRRVADTSLAAPDDIVAEAGAAAIGGSTYTAAPRSVVVLIADRVHG